MFNMYAVDHAGHEAVPSATGCTGIGSARFIAPCPYQEAHQVVHDLLLGRLHLGAHIDCPHWPHLTTKWSSAVRTFEPAG
jgi:hypothetical protein